jgi:selenocysteine lyase/cysteine desulfurase
MPPVADKPLVDVRADFPVLGREFHGKRVAYLDSAATSQRPQQVIEAMDHFQRESYAPIHRGVYELARESTDAFENWDPATSIFTRNATEAINLVAYARAASTSARRGCSPNTVLWHSPCETGASWLPHADRPHELSLDELTRCSPRGA